VIELMQDRGGFLVEDFPCCCRPNAPRTALKQGHSQPFLQFGNLLAQRRLGYMNDGGCAGEAACLDDLDEISKLTELHFVLPIRGPHIINEIAALGNPICASA
jgi:hypothetical protein